MALKTNPLLKPRSELKSGIDNLRPLVREIANAFVVQAEAEIVALSEAVRDLPNPESDSKAAQRQEKLLDEMQDFVAGLKVKPEKGRLKDLRRVRDVLDELNKLVQNFAK
jgi:hypothetical protein